MGVSDARGMEGPRGSTNGTVTADDGVHRSIPEAYGTGIVPGGPTLSMGGAPLSDATADSNGHASHLVPGGSAAVLGMTALGVHSRRR